MARGAAEPTGTDAIDDRIVHLLVRNGRASYRELGDAVGLSPHAAAERVRRLVDRGVITGFTACVDDAAVGRTLQALVDVRLAPDVDPDAFERAVVGLASVRSVVFVTGRFDYQLRLACADADDLDQTVRHLRQKAGAALTETRIVLRSRTGRPSR
jgi:Lrp/AsnC family leucine-responsive transcriptional regulator